MGSSSREVQACALIVRPSNGSTPLVAFLPDKHSAFCVGGKKLIWSEGLIADLLNTYFLGSLSCPSASPLDALSWHLRNIRSMSELPFYAGHCDVCRALQASTAMIIVIPRVLQLLR